MIDVLLSELLAEVGEQESKRIATASAGYAESGPTFDPSGDYLCGTCIFRLMPDKCAVMKGKISMETGSCISWYKGDQAYTEPFKHQATQMQLIYTERPNVKGFGCKRCEYSKDGYCAQWKMQVEPNACCFANEGPDDVLAPGDRDVSAATEEEVQTEAEELEGILATVLIEIEAGGPGSGCYGDNCGRPTLYHGTVASRARSITQIGLKTKKNLPTVTTNKKEAEEAAKLVAEETGEKPVVVVLKDSANDLFDTGETEYGVSTYRNSSSRLVKPEHILRVDKVEAEALFNGIKIEGFTGPEEEFIRAAMSRIPPELTTGVVKVLADRGMGAKHGNYSADEKTIRINPNNFRLRMRLGKGQGWMLHAETTMVHEFGHSVFEGLTDEQRNEWLALSGWRKSESDGDGSFAERYIEHRPGWPPYTSKWIHKKGVGFTRKYAEKNPDEDFADSFSFFILGKPMQMAPKKRAFLEALVKEKVKRYPSALIAGPTKAYVDASVEEFLADLFAGGPGSGCHGPNCGRPRTKEFSEGGSTEEHFKDPATGQWDQERQDLHQQVVNDMVAGKTPVEGRRPVAYVLGGGTASGKTTASSQIIGNNQNVLRVDPDEIKLKVPEYEGLKKSDPKNAAMRVHEESSLMTKKVMAEGIARGLDITYDATTSGKGSMAMVQALKDNGYDVHLMFVDVPVQTAIARSAARAQNPNSLTGYGRNVPEYVIHESHQRAAQNFFILKDSPGIKSARLYDNSGKRPVLVYSKQQFKTEVIHDNNAFERYRRKASEE